jgi:predicted lactoylglutathione lyase
LIRVTRVDFVAVPVEDLARADEFYGETVGLTRNPNTSGERWIEYETGNLTIGLSTQGGAIAIGVDNFDEAHEELSEQGVASPGEPFDSGVCNGAPLSDPDGNNLLIHRRYAPLEKFEVPVQEVERTDFIGVNVKNRSTSAEFYAQQLGLVPNPNASEEWPELEASNVGVVLSTPEQKGGGEFKPEFSIALRVRDVGETMERLQKAGVKFEFAEPYDSGVCHMAFFSDPDGNSLILHHRYAPYRDGSKP